MEQQQHRNMTIKCSNLRLQTLWWCLAIVGRPQKISPKIDGKFLHLPMRVWKCRRTNENNFERYKRSGRKNIHTSRTMMEFWLKFMIDFCIIIYSISFTTCVYFTYKTPSFWSPSTPSRLGWGLDYGLHKDRWQTLAKVVKGIYKLDTRPHFWQKSSQKVTQKVTQKGDPLLKGDPGDPKWVTPISRNFDE